MSNKRQHSRWWQTWVCLVGFGVLGFVVAKAHLSAAGHRTADLAIVLLVYGLLFLWLRANQGVRLCDEYDERVGAKDVLTDDLGGDPDVPVKVDGGRAVGRHPKLERGAR